MSPDTGTPIQRCLDRLRAGDASARDELLRLSRHRLLVITRKMLHGFPGVRRWEEPEDILHNVFFRLDRCLSEVPLDSPRAFLALAATHIRRELLRMNDLVPQTLISRRADINAVEKLNVAWATPACISLRTADAARLRQDLVAGRGGRGPPSAAAPSGDNPLPSAASCAGQFVGGIRAVVGVHGPGRARSMSSRSGRNGADPNLGRAEAQRVFAVFPEEGKGEGRSRTTFVTPSSRNPGA